MTGRLDQLLVQRGLFESRERARRSIMAGSVFVDGRRIDKAGTQVKDDVSVEVRGAAEPFVSRAGRKLDEALERFGVDPLGRVCLDVGASTGGFTDCLLQRGARRVYALDVGYGQLAERLRRDPRVVVMERTNARHLPADALPERVSLVTIDVSFISLSLVAPPVLAHLEPGGWLLALVKPQFEAGREQVGKGGIVRDESVRRGVIGQRVGEMLALGVDLVGCEDCSVRGAEGNREAIAAFRLPGHAAHHATAGAPS